MKLSEAMMLGDLMRKRVNHIYLSVHPDGACGCAIGGATLAMGRTGNEDHEALWPWLREKGPHGRLWDYVIGIGAADGNPSFTEVMRGHITFEQLVDYVRSIEPACGECNRFECTCAPKEEPSRVEVHVSV